MRLAKINGQRQTIIGNTSSRVTLCLAPKPQPMCLAMLLNIANPAAILQPSCRVQSRRSIKTAEDKPWLAAFSPLHHGIGRVPCQEGVETSRFTAAGYSFHSPDTSILSLRTASNKRIQTASCTAKRVAEQTSPQGCRDLQYLVTIFCFVRLGYF